jgi:hypothetical protein
MCTWQLAMSTYHVCARLPGLSWPTHSSYQSVIQATSLVDDLKQLRRCFPLNTDVHALPTGAQPAAATAYRRLAVSGAVDHIFR